METMKTATRTFALRSKGETKTALWVEIVLKDYSDVVGAWLPKDQIKITNRVYGWGGKMSADITFPVSLISLFKPTR